MTSTSSLGFAALNFDCTDPAGLAAFWGKALGRPFTPGTIAGDMAVTATDPASGPRLIFHPVPAAERVKSRGVRPILVTEQHAEEIERLTGLGAELLDEAKLPGVRVSTLADPEGNEFNLVTFQPE
jgi:hypothetical protein